MTCINVSRIATTFALTACAFLAGCSSSPVSKGIVFGQLGACPNSPNCVISYDTDDTHKIEALHFTGNKTAASLKLKNALASRDDAKIVEEKNDYIRAEFTSKLMGFVDDGEFLIKDGTIDVRSASRMGYSDLGKNRSRMEEIRAAFEPCCD